VWKARDTRLNRIVAIKISTAKFSERFAQEARAIAALNHPHICTLHDVGPDYLVMEYVEGPQIGGPLPLDRVLMLAIELASALEAAHRQGITHAIPNPPTFWRDEIRRQDCSTSDWRRLAAQLWRTIKP
jgi:serine/threonine protein kinase